MDPLGKYLSGRSFFSDLDRELLLDCCPRVDRDDSDWLNIGDHMPQIDVARVYLSEHPVRTNRLAIVLSGLSAGFVGRAALAFLQKNMDTS